MKIIPCSQGSADWWSAKLGIPSASNFDKILTPVTAKPSAQQDDYIAQLVAEKLFPEANFFSERGTTRPMQYGIDTEPQARKWYALYQDEPVTEVGFVLDDQERFGCSPDGLVGEAGLLELKCPLPATQIGYLTRPEKLAMTYRCQTHGQLIVTGRAWVDLVSYCPPMPEVVIRVVPDEFTLKLREALEAFWGRFTDAVARLAEGVTK